MRSLCSLALPLFITLSVSGCVSQSGGGSAASSSALQGVTRNEASAKARTELAAQYYEHGQYGVALDETAKALRANPDYATAYTVRALVHMDLGEYKEADDDFKRSLRLRADDPDTHNNYGWFLCQRGREREAMQHFMTALKNPLYTTPAMAYLNAGVCAKRAGQTQDAEGFLRKALLLQPDLPGALIGLAEIDFNKGDFSSAKSNFTRYAQSNGAALTAQNLWLAVRIERKLGDRNAEDSYALQLHKRFPDAPETQLLLGGKQ